MTSKNSLIEKNYMYGNFRICEHFRMLEKKYKIYSYIKCIFVMHCGICFKNAYAYDLVVSSSDILYYS